MHNESRITSEVKIIAADPASDARTHGRTRDPERKARIMGAAADLVARKGYHAVSMAEIGSAAGITGSGVYRHFDSKSRPRLSPAAVIGIQRHLR
jgi:AcrR family transcriptional regulator